MPAATRASVDVATVAQRFNFEWATDPDSVEGVDTYWWYASSIRVDPSEVIANDDEGNLWSIPFTTDGADAVTFGDPVRVRETFVPVAAPDGAAATAAVSRRSQRVLADAMDRPTKPDHPTASASAEPESQQEAPMDENVRQVLVGQGLDPEAATEEQINAAQVFASAQPAPAAEEPEAETEATVTPPLAPAPAAQEPTPATQVPEGMQLVDAGTLSELQAAAAQSSELYEERRVAARERLLDTAASEGRFPPFRRAHYATAYDKDTEGTTRLLTASAEEGGLAPGLVPVAPKGNIGPMAGADDPLITAAINRIRPGSARQEA